MSRKSNTTLRREFIAYCKNERGHTPATVYVYDTACQRLVQHLGGVHLSEATVGHLRSLVLAPTRKGPNGRGVEPSAATKKRRVSELRSFFNWLHAEGYVPSNPALRLVAPPVHNENPKPFAPEVWRELWASELSDSDRVAFGLAMFCGLRRAEITALASGHFIDVPRPIIANFRRKGGRKRNLPWLSCVRLFGERRPALIGGDAATFVEPLRRLRSERAGEPTLLDWPQMRERPKHPVPPGFIDPQRFGKRLKRALSAAGLPADAGAPHMMRHAFCTNLLDMGVPLLDVSRLAGHASVTMTQRYLETSEDPLAGLLGVEDADESVPTVNRWGL